jgi:phospholipid/cholesterol/gamma-HCH transport system substrate-binding protein
MRLRDDLRPLVRSDSISAVQTDGIVGSAFIQVNRGSDEAAVVQPGDTIEGRDPVEFSDLIEEGRQTFQTVAREISDLGEEMSGVVGGLVDVTDSTAQLIDDVGGDVRLISASSARFVEDSRQLVTQANGITADIRAGRGSIGKLLTDDALYDRMVTISAEAESAVGDVRAATGRAREMVEGLASRDGAAQEIAQSLRDTLADTREVMSDLSEGTEALKRNFLFRGFFQDRGFFDLDALSREAYAAGALAGDERTPIRIWVDAAGLFTRGADGAEVLTDEGRRRVDSVMADLVRYPRESPLVVEGYADRSDEGAAYLVSSDRALRVRDYLLSRYRRDATLTGVMPMATEAAGSPRGDGSWSGIALTLFVRTDALRGGR